MRECWLLPHQQRPLQQPHLPLGRLGISLVEGLGVAPRGAMMLLKR